MDTTKREGGFSDIFNLEGQNIKNENECIFLQFYTTYKSPEGINIICKKFANKINMQKASFCQVNQVRIQMFHFKKT